MTWTVILDEAFAAEFVAFPRDVQTALLAKARLLEHYGPQLGRPHVDTLKDSKHANMKELRFDAADGAWRAAFASGKRSSSLPVTSRAEVRSGFTAH